MIARRLVKWLLLSLLGVVVLLGLAIAAVFVVLPLSATREWVRAELETILSSALDDRVEIAAVSSLEPSGITLEGVSIGGETPVATATSLTLELRIPQLARPRLAIDIVLVEPDLGFVLEEDGRWNVEHWAGEETDTDETDDDLGIPRWIGRIGVDVRDGDVSVAGVAPDPMRLSSLELSGRLWVGVSRDSVIEVDRLTATLGRDSQIGLHGTYEVEGEERFHAALRAEPLAGNDLAGLVPSLRDDVRLTGNVDAEGTFDWPKLDLDLRSGAAHLVAHGQLLDDEEEPTVRLSFDGTSIDPAQLFEDAPAGDVTAKGEGTVVLVGDEITNLQGRVAVTKSRLFDVDVGSLDVHAATKEGDVDLQIDISTPDAGLSASVQSFVQLSAPHRIRATGEVAMKDPAALSEDLRSYLSGSDLQGTIVADIDDPLADAPTATLDVSLAPGHLRGVPVDGAELQVRLRPDLVSLDRLWISADRTNLEGHAWAQLTGAADERPVGGEFRGPVSLALFMDAFGVVDTDVTFWGGQTDLGVSALVSSSGPVELPGLEGTFSSRVDAAHLGGAGGEAKLDVTGVFAPEPSLARILGRDDRPTTLRASWARTPGQGGAAPLDRIELDTRMGPSHPSGVSLQVVVESRGDRTHVDIPGFEIRPIVGPPWKLAPAAAVELTADGIDVDGVRIDVGKGRIEAQGRVAGEGGSRNDMNVAVANVDLNIVCQLLVVGDECAGRLGANLDVKGAGARPDVSFELGITDLTASEQLYGDLRATAQTRGDQLAIAATLQGGEAGSLDVNGRLPLEPGGRAPTVSMERDAEVALRITDLQVDALRAFAGRAVRRLDGRATARVDLRGPLRDPRLDGRLTIQDLTFGATATGATHRGGRVEVSIDPRRFALDELTLDGGAITAGGNISLDAGLPTAFDLWLALDQAVVVSRPEADVTTSGRLALTGPVGAPRLDGEVLVDRATIRPTVAPGGSAPAPDATVVVVRRYGAEPAWTSGVPPALGGEKEPRPIRPVSAGPRASAGSSSLYDDLGMMVTVRLGDPVLVRRYDANIRLDGEVYLTKAPADEVRITGGIGGRRGWYIFQGRRFEIQSAYVTFTGETPLDPYLDVDARYRAGDYQVRIQITGTTGHPSLDLSSDPPLDQSDILAVILFGKPASQLNESQGQVLQSQALALLASYVAPELQRSVLDTFGLTSLTFSMPTGDTAGTIGVGRYFGDDIFVSVARDFGGPSGGTDRQLQGLVGSSVTIQYYLTPSVTVQGASSTEGESSVDVIWQRRYSRSS